MRSVRQREQGLQTAAFVWTAHERNMESGGKPGESVTVIPLPDQRKGG